MTKVSLMIGGMHCGSCSMAIEMVLKDTKGVKSAKVDYNSKKAEIEFDPKQINVAELKRAVTKIGFTASE